MNTRVESEFARKRGLLAIAAALLVILPLAWLKPLDGLADDYVQKGLKRALVTFAVARTANAVISVIQESTIEAKFVVGGTLAVGQVLDPINDLIEQFSTVMLVACVSFAIQATLMEIAKTWHLSLILSAFLAWWAVARYLRWGSPEWATKGLVLLLVVRFAVPLIALSSEATYQALLTSKHQAAEQGFRAVTTELDHSAKNLGPKDLWDYLKTATAKVELMVEDSIRLMGIFIVQTIVLPLVFLWFTVWMFRNLFAGERQISTRLSG